MRPRKPRDSTPSATLRCAIYTRRSSEEGLEQSFNSLHAQRESCEAYIREMHDRYGAPGFLAAYNAGPGRYEAYLKEGRVLPAETRHYVAKIAPALDGSQRPASISVAPDPYAWTRASLFAPRSTSAPPDAVAAPSARVPVTSQASLGGLFIAVSSRSTQ